MKAGQELTYAIKYQNTTGEDKEVTIKDAIPAHTTFVSADEGGQEAGGTITWKKKVANGASWTVTFKVKVNADVNGETIKNKAVVNDGKNDYTTNETNNPTPVIPKTPEKPSTPPSKIIPKTGEVMSWLGGLGALLLVGLGVTYSRRKHW